MTTGLFVAVRMAGAWLKKGAHLDLVGAFTPAMREADDAAVRRARIYVDSRASAPAQGKPRETPRVVTRGGAIGAFDTRGDFAVAARSSINAPPDLFRVSLGSGEAKQLTRENENWLREVAFSTPESLTVKGAGDAPVQYWLIKPPNFDAAKKYPLILEIHGGPHTEYGWAFFHEFQWMAAKGYVVLYTNPRGSTSYGQEFANIIQHRYPGDDYKDLMIGVDELLKRGYVDEKRMGVTGGSGGGLLTNWTVTQTSRFAAAVSQRSVADWLSFWYTADFTLFRPTWFRKYPFQDPEEYLNRSPVRFVEKVTTPLMFIHSEEDWRTPPGQGAEPMFRALKALKKTTVMVRFPGESHDLSRGGKPAHRVER